MTSRLLEYARVLPYVAGRYPALFYPMLHTVRGLTKGDPVTRETDVVIEGYPRSGNTFAVTALRMAQSRPLRVASYLHVPAQVVRASRMGLPTCVLIREPGAAARSLVVKFPFLRPIDVLRGYAAFYRACARYRAQFVVARFDRVITDFGGVVDAINQRFGTDFARFEHTAENVSRVFEQIDAENQTDFGGRVETSDRPLRGKDRKKSDIPLEGCERTLARCERIYEEFVRDSA
jgi:hypothetical protein